MNKKPSSASVRTAAATVVTCCLALTWATGICHAQSSPEPESAATAEQASAQGPSKEDRERASARFQRAVRLYHEGAYPAALAEFEQAYAELPDYRLLYNIGQVHVLTQDYVVAREKLRAYLEAGGTDIKPARRQEVDAMLLELEGRVGELNVHANLPVRVFIDGEPPTALGVDSRMAVSAGSHRIVVEDEHGRTQERTLRVAGNVLQDVHFEFGAAPPIAQAQEGTEARRGLNRPHKWAVGVAATTLLAGVGGVTAAVLAGKAQDDFDAALGARPSDPKAIDSARKKAERSAWAADGLFVGTAVLAVTATVLWIVGREPERSDSPQAGAWLDKRSGGVTVQGSF